MFRSVAKSGGELPRSEDMRKITEKKRADLQGW